MKSIRCRHLIPVLVVALSACSPNLDVDAPAARTAPVVSASKSLWSGKTKPGCDPRYPDVYYAAQIALDEKVARIAFSKVGRFSEYGGVEYTQITDNRVLDVFDPRSAARLFVKLPSKNAIAFGNLAGCSIILEKTAP